MSNVAETSNNIDDMLEQIALAMAGGENALAMKLLPKVMAEGDDVQQQMAEAYQTQLELLIQMEEESAELAELIDDGSSDSEADLDDVEIDGSETEVELQPHAEAELDDAVRADSDTVATEVLAQPTGSTDVADLEISSTTEEGTSKEIDQIVDEAKKLVPEMTATAAVTATEESQSLSSQMHTAYHHPDTDGHNQDISVDDIFEDVFGANKAPETIETEMLVEAKVDEATSDAVSAPADDSAALSPQEREVALTLEQVAMLIADGEYETAEILIPSALENGNDEQQQIAEAYLAQVAQALSEPDVVIATASIEDQTPSVDDVLQEAPEGLFAVANEVADTEHETAVSTEIETTASAFADTSESDKSDSALIDEAVEVFADDEPTDHLLPPTKALDLFEFSDLSLLPQSSSAKTEVQNQRQAFFVGDVGLMIEFADGSELTEMPTYYRVPNAPSWLLGLTNLHGIVIPIFNLQEYLNLNDAEYGKEMLLVLQHNEKAVGVVINGLPRRLAYQQSQQMNNNTAPDGLSPFIHGVYLVGDRLWFDLDSASLCNGLESTLQA